jgi:oligopeptide transport system substrate-binding protein
LRAEAGRGLLDRTGASRYGDVANLPPITVTTGGWGGSISQNLEAIIAEWRQNLGVEVTVRQLEPDSGTGLD